MFRESTPTSHRTHLASFINTSYGETLSQMPVCCPVKCPLLLSSDSNQNWNMLTYFSPNVGYEI